MLNILNFIALIDKNKWMNSYSWIIKRIHFYDNHFICFWGKSFQSIREVNPISAYDVCSSSDRHSKLRTDRIFCGYLVGRSFDWFVFFLADVSKDSLIHLFSKMIYQLNSLHVDMPILPIIFFREWKHTIRTRLGYLLLQLSFLLRCIYWARV
jgi:hypothetical protein